MAKLARRPIAVPMADIPGNHYLTLVATLLCLWLIPTMLHRSISPSLIQPPFINSNQTAQAGSPSHPRLNYEGKILEMMIFFRYSYKWLSMGSQGRPGGHPYMLRSATHAAICRGDPGGRPSINHPSINHPSINRPAINRPAIGLQLLSP